MFMPIVALEMVPQAFLSAAQISHFSIHEVLPSREPGVGGGDVNVGGEVAILKL